MSNTFAKDAKRRARDSQPDTSFEKVWRYECGKNKTMVLKYEGNWVKHSDYAALAAERDALQAKLDEAVEAQVGDIGAIKEKAHRQGYEQGKAAGDAFGAAIREHVERLEAERDALQAKLEKAVLVLQICCNFMEYGTWPDRDPVVLAQTTLAELKGQDDAVLHGD